MISSLLQSTQQRLEASMILILAFSLSLLYILLDEIRDI